MLFDGNRAKYRVSTSEFVMRVPEDDIAGEIVGQVLQSAHQNVDD